jgi:hypothetical protein
MVVRWRELLRSPLFSAVVLLSAVLSLTGAFGSFVAVMPLRFAFWLLTLVTASGALFCSSKLVRAWRARPLPGIFLTIITAALPTAAAAGILATLFRIPGLPVAGAPAFTLIGLSVTPPLYVLWRMLERGEAAVASSRIPTFDGSVPEAIASKLPFRLARSDLVAVEAQDHYLRVITRDGEALVHMRFADALSALRHMDGMQVHRSWWVAAGAIDDVRIASGRGLIVANNDLRVPVSRSFSAAVRARFRGRA